MGLPRVGHIAAIYLLIYSVVLNQNIKIWPILLLGSVPLLNLTSYTGRFAINEFDSLILLTFGMVWYKQEKNSDSKTQIELILFILLILIGFISGLNAFSIFPSVDEHYLTVYQQSINIWRVGKSLLYALLLYLLIHKSHKQITGEIIRNVALGACLSIIVLVLIIFWEKGVLYAIFSGASLRSILGSALYFSIDFRPTALFPAMHTGGGSLDSYIAIMFIFPIFLLYGKSSNTAKYIFLLTLLSGLYCALATVSRTVIAATAMTTIIIVSFQLYQSSKTQTTTPPLHSKLLDILKIPALLILWVVSLITIQPHMGTEGILSLPTFTFAISLAIYQLKKGRPYPLGIVILICSLLITEALFDRIDKGIKPEEVLYKGILLIGLITINTAAFILKFKTFNQIKPFALPLFIFITASIFMSMGFSSASLANRLNEITKDTSGRQQHWDTIKSTGSDDFTHQLIGNGPGTMPLNYSLAYTGTDYFTVRQIDPIRGELSVLGSGQALIQRIAIQPEETYTLSTSLRSKDTKGGITVALCNRNIIIQTTHNGTCTNPKGLRLNKKNEWQNFSFQLPTESLRKEGGIQSLTNFVMKFYRFTSPVEIRHIGLIDSKGRQILLNPGFENDLDFWFWASDFQHFGWHSKNAFLHQYFELGGLGLLLTLAILLSISLKTLVKRKSLDPSIQIATYSMVLSFILLGCFITILDDPQIATFWYLGFLIFSLLVTNHQIAIPSFQTPSFNSFSNLLISKKNNLYLVWNRKRKLFIAYFLLITFLCISTDFYTRFEYNTSPAQVIARFNSSRIEGLKYEYPYLNFIWNFIDSVAPDDERFL